MADDDSVLFVDNIVQVLSKYEHTKYFYLSASSEMTLSNALYVVRDGLHWSWFCLELLLGGSHGEDTGWFYEEIPSDLVWRLSYLHVHS